MSGEVAVAVLLGAYMQTAKEFIDRHRPDCDCTPIRLHRAAYFHLSKIHKEVVGLSHDEFNKPKP